MDHTRLAIVQIRQLVFVVVVVDVVLSLLHGPYLFLSPDFSSLAVKLVP